MRSYWGADNEIGHFDGDTTALNGIASQRFFNTASMLIALAPRTAPAGRPPEPPRN